MLEADPKQRKQTSGLDGRSRRMWVYLAILLAVAAWRFLPRPWTPSSTLETAHYTILTTATAEQAQRVSEVVEVLYREYSNRLSHLPGFRPSGQKLKMKLYRDRKEFRWVNPGLDWAEAFYRKPYCQAYFSVAESNPYHWMVHEAVHQLNEEVAHLRLNKWLEEGTAEYFSTCYLTNGTLRLGSIDPSTYPVWWLEELAVSTNLEANLENGSVIPLRSIITDRGGPSMRQHVNLYYLHWWTLAHYVFEMHPAQVLQLLQEGGDLASFERHIGPVDQVQRAWHAHVQAIKQSMQRGGGGLE